MMTTKKEIKKLCEIYYIRTYTINNDMTINVTGDVWLDRNNFTSIPLNFNIVTGDFNCSYNKLTSLEGCPKYVGGHFACHRNNLSNLEYSPERVDGYFTCHHSNLTSLKGCPKYVGDDFMCDQNKITSLDGLPVDFYIGRDFNCGYNAMSQSTDFGKLFFGTIKRLVYTNNIEFDQFLNKHKNPPKKDLPKILSELRKIQL